VLQKCVCVHACVKVRVCVCVHVCVRCLKDKKKISVKISFVEWEGGSVRQKCVRDGKNDELADKLITRNLNR